MKKLIKKAILIWLSLVMIMVVASLVLIPPIFIRIYFHEGMGSIIFAGLWLSIWVSLIAAYYTQSDDEVDNHV